MSCEVISEKMVETRKGHTCFACGRRFPPRSIMHYQANKCDGEIYSLYVCGTCNELLQKQKPSLWDDFNEHFPEYCVFESIKENGFSTPEEWLQSIS